jgi:hypothetical protein
MPKRAPDSVVNYRFELQEHERELLGMIGASQTFRNVGQGIGAILDPILDNIVAILGFIIAKEGIEWLIDAFDRAEERMNEEKSEVESNLYQKYVEEYNSLYGPNGTVVRSNTYENYVQNYEEKYAEGSPEYIRLGRLNLPHKFTRAEWEAEQEEYPALMSEAEFIQSLQESDAAWYDLLNPLTSSTVTGKPTTQKGYAKAVWWQKWVGTPLRTGIGNTVGTLKFW